MDIMGGFSGYRPYCATADNLGHAISGKMESNKNKQSTTEELGDAEPSFYQGNPVIATTLLQCPHHCFLSHLTHFLK